MLAVLALVAALCSCKKTVKDLERATRWGGPKEVGAVLDRGVDPNANGEDGRPIVLMPLSEIPPRCDTLQVFLAHGLDPNLRIGPSPAITDSRPLLALVAARGSAPCAQMLLDKGARIEELDDDGMTPLMCAAASGNAEAVQLLLARGANKDARRDGAGKQTALDIARFKGGAAVVAVLEDAGAK